MKKLTALLALFLLLTLLAQGACAATVNSYAFYNGSAPYTQIEDLLFCNAKPVDTPYSDYSGFRMILSSPYSENETLPSHLQQSFASFFATQNLSDPEPGYVRKAKLVDMKLMANDGDIEKELLPNDGNSRVSCFPYIPLNEFIPAGTQFRNLRVYHGAEQFNSSDNLPSAWSWQFQDSALYNNFPKVIQDENGSFVFSEDNKLKSDLTASKSDYYLQISINYGFSPFVIVWDESPAAAPLSVPQTGDSSSLAPWLLLLGGACALLLLAKKKSAASA